MTRVVASLVEWKDDKGYGFAREPGGTERVFVHASSLAEGMRRPKRGDSVEFDIVPGKRGPAAAHTRIVTAKELGQRLPLHVVTATMLFILVQLVVILGRAPFGLSVYYTLMGVLSLYLYGRDKQAAITGAWRISENRLLLVDLLGGVVGGLLAQHRYWHKTSKQRYQNKVFAIVLVHAALLAALGSGLLLPTVALAGAVFH